MNLLYSSNYFAGKIRKHRKRLVQQYRLTNKPTQKARLQRAIGVAHLLLHEAGTLGAICDDLRAVRCEDHDGSAWPDTLLRVLTAYEPKLGPSSELTEFAEALLESYRLRTLKKADEEACQPANHRQTEAGRNRVLAKLRLQAEQRVAEKRQLLWPILHLPEWVAQTRARIAASITKEELHQWLHYEGCVPVSQ
ncbi:hypothetical protein [Hymenobacter sp. AT01-02]|uniref:hypothetical protein n=1 Tax=Hymenobacter sp. AT01-02 TaxID=1571877 RepID=UPI0005F1CB3F|nr:hypothetical protein [Hymenobacter sp. AT01-02]